MTMTKMNGYEVCDKLRSDPLHRDIPVMMLTALGQTDRRSEKSAENTFNVITKPFSPYSVLDRVKEILKG